VAEILHVVDMRMSFDPRYHGAQPTHTDEVDVIPRALCAAADISGIGAS